MRNLLLAILFPLLSDLIPLGGIPHAEEENGPYTRYVLTDSATLEVFEADSMIVVMTVCAPQCSSRARIYNKEWTLIRDIEPTVRSIFPLATMNQTTGQITWTDNDNWEY